MEDQNVSHTEIKEHFSIEIADGVRWLSDMETGNRVERKEAAKRRLALAPGWIQSIKCADIISNSKNIVEHDKKFAILYLSEIISLLDVMDKANVELWAVAKSQCRI